MKKAKHSKGMKFKLWAYFTVFTVLIMAMLWIFEILMLNRFYISMKTNELKDFGDEITEKYNDEDEDFKTDSMRLAFQNGVWMKMFDVNGNIILGNGPVSYEESREEFSQLVDKIGNNNSVTYRYKVDFKMRRETGNDDGEKNVPRYLPHFTPASGFSDSTNPDLMTAICYASRLCDESGNTVGYIYINSTVKGIEMAVSVLAHQLCIVSIISLCFALAIAYIISRRLAKPITKMAATAEELARGNYDVEFKKGGYREIDELSSVLTSAAQEMSKTDRLRRELIANVSHDLRTPLTIIKSYAEMIRDLSGDNPEKRKLHTQVIIDESDRLSLLVNDMLDLSKYESGTAEVKKEKIDLAEMVNAIMQRFEYLKESEGYDMKVECAQKAVITGDERMMQQVIYNLIGNAVNYTGDDKKIYVRVEKTDENNVRFSVTDTGDGISPDEIDLVWDRYYRASSMRTRKGSGIGLAVVKNILDLHDAKRGVISKEKRGSTFWFELPLKND